MLIKIVFVILFATPIFLIIYLYNELQSMKRTLHNINQFDKTLLEWMELVDKDLDRLNNNQ